MPSGSIQNFLVMMGLRQDMNRAFTAVGWSHFADITEPGPHLLTMEFLLTLHVETVGKETKIHFHFFNEFFEMLPRDFSNALVFSKKCLLESNALQMILNMTIVLCRTKSQMNQ